MVVGEYSARRVFSYVYNSFVSGVNFVRSGTNFVQCNDINRFHRGYLKSSMCTTWCSSFYICDSMEHSILVSVEISEEN